MIFHRIIHLPLLLTLMISLLYGCERYTYRSSYESSRSASEATNSSLDAAASSVAGGKYVGLKYASPITLEMAFPSEMTVEQDAVIEIRARNITDTPFSDVVVAHTLASNFKSTATSPTATQVSGRKLSWHFNQINPGETKTIRISGQPVAQGTIDGCTTVTFSPGVCATGRVVQPALRLTKSAPAEALLCQTIPFKFIISNPGTGTARNVVIEDRLPDGMVAVDGAGHMLALKIGDLPGGATKELTVMVRALDTGKYINKASARADGNITATSEQVITMVREPKLVISKNGPEKSFIGRLVTYSINIVNKGDAPANATVIEDQIDSTAKFVSASDGGRLEGNKVVWNLGALPAGGSRRVLVTVNPAGPGRIANTAIVKADCARTVSASAATVITGISAILLEVVDEPDPIRVGDDVVYTITVTNQGSAVGTNIRINAETEDTMEFVSATGATPGSVSGKRITFAALPQLAPGAVATWKVKVKAIGEGDVRFHAAMNSDQLTRDVQETEATNFYK